MAWEKGSGAIDEHTDWWRDGESVYAARWRVSEHRLCRGWGANVAASDVAGYPSRVLPEPDVDK